MTDKPSQEIATQNGPKAGKTEAMARVGRPALPIVPVDVEECWQMAQYISQSGVAPKSYPGGPGTREKSAACFGAIQMGATVGLVPMAALSTIMVVNGRYCLWGDGPLAIIRKSGELAKIEEKIEGDTQLPKRDWSEDVAATCYLKRTDGFEWTETFSVRDAINAGVWGKEGPWQAYPRRMLMWRARQFCIRTVFPDILLGLQYTAEEIMEFGETIDGTYNVINQPVAVEPPPPPKPPHPTEEEPPKKDPLKDLGEEEKKPEPEADGGKDAPLSLTDWEGNEIAFDNIDDIVNGAIDLMEECPSFEQLTAFWEDNGLGELNIDASAREFLDDAWEAHVERFRPEEAKTESDNSAEEPGEEEETSEPEPEGSAEQEAEPDPEPVPEQEAEPEPEQEAESEPEPEKDPEPEAEEGADLAKWRVRIEKKEDGSVHQMKLYADLTGMIDATKSVQDLDHVIEANKEAMAALKGMAKRVEKRIDTKRAKLTSK